MIMRFGLWYMWFMKMVNQRMLFTQHIPNNTCFLRQTGWALFEVNHQQKGTYVFHLIFITIVFILCLLHFFSMAFTWHVAVTRSIDHVTYNAFCFCHIWYLLLPFSPKWWHFCLKFFICKMQSEMCKGLFFS